MRIIWNEVPEFVAAVREETTERDCSFFLPTERIAGIDVLPFTPRHLLILDSIRSPHLFAGTLPNEIDAARFLWIVSPGFSATLNWRTRRRRGKFLRSCRKLKLQAVCDGISEYLDEALADSPGGSDEDQGRPADTSWMAAVVDRLASEYGWPEQAIIDMPFKRIWQYYRCIRRRHDPNAVFINRVDRVKRMHFEKLLKREESNGD